MPRLTDLRVALRARLVKAADIGGAGQDGEFEASFANLASAYLRDRAPGLLDFEIGFSLVSKDIDPTKQTSKAVGVFGFKVGSQWLYAPVFFINGDLKGHELLYIKDQDQFVPLKENWINSILAKKPQSLGEGVGRDSSRLGVTQPDLYRALQSPYKYASWAPGEKDALRAEADALRSKVAAAKVPGTDGFALLPDWAAVGWAKLAAAALRAAKPGELALPSLLKAGGVPILQALHAHVATRPSLQRALDATYGPDGLKEAMAKAAAFTPPARPLAPLLRKTARHASLLADLRAEVRDKVVVHRFEGFGKAASLALSEAEREALVADGVLVKDAREDDEVSRAYAVPVRTQFETRFRNPGESGIYSTLLKSGELARCLVILAPAGPARHMPFATVVRLDAGTKRKPWLNVHQSYVWTEGEPGEYRDWFEGLPEAGDLPKGKAVMLVGPRMTGTVPVTPIRDLGKDAGGGTAHEAKFEVAARHYRPPISGAAGPRDGDDPGGDGYDPFRDGQRLHVGQATGTKLRIHLGDVYVPEGFKVLRLEEDAAEPDANPAKVLKLGPALAKADEGPVKADSGPPGDDDPPAEDTDPAISAYGGGSEEGEQELVLGNALDIEAGFLKKTASLVVACNGGVARVNGVAGTPAAALEHLVVGHGLREDAARGVLKLASDLAIGTGQMVTWKGRIKYADGYPAQDPYLTGGGPYGPGVEDQQPPLDYSMGTNNGVGMLEQSREVGDLRVGSGNRDAYQPNDVPDPMALQSAQQAADTGQKELFDTAIIGSLLKGTRDDTLVTKHLKALKAGLNAIGTMIFNLYAHGQQFSERYGEDQMPELEDSLRNLFEDTGDAYLMLSEREIEADPTEDLQRTDLDSVADE